MIKRTGFYLSGLSLIFGAVVFSDARSASVEQYDYPELSVAPRASERLKAEAEKEAAKKWTTYLPIQASALTTLVAGVASTGLENKGPSYVGIGVGAGWLAVTALMSAYYRPYSSGYQGVSSMAKGTTREQLIRERAAEEEIKQAASTGTRIKWLSVLSNLGSSAYMIAQYKGDKFDNFGNFVPGVSGATLGFQVAAAALAFAPVVFNFHWNHVSDEQMDYKKRIYAPVASATILMDSGTQRPVPGVALSMRF